MEDVSSSLVENWKKHTTDQVELLSEWLDTVRSDGDRDTVEEKAKEVGADVAKQIDCLDCGNCCRTSVTDFTKGDIKRAAKHLNITPKGFIKQYLIEDIDGTYITITTPCPMLNEDNTCKIYEVRPKVCESYPHVQRDRFMNRIHAHQKNLSMCPITYHTIKRMKDQLTSD